jgi:hypothetical protein
VGTSTAALAITAFLLIRLNRAVPPPPRNPQPLSLNWEQLAAALDKPLKDPLVLQELNIRAARFSSELGKSVLNPEELAAFINPDIPIDAILRHQKALGKGSFRQVALFEASSGPLAVKFSETGPLDGSTEGLTYWLDAAKREFEVGAALNHPNVMQVYNFAVKRQGDQLRAYILCEYVPGMTLRQASELSPTSRLDLLAQVGMTFRDLKKLGIRAEDLHDENALVTPDGLLKFIDLGFWRAQADLASIEESASSWLGFARLIGIDAEFMQQLVRARFSPAGSSSSSS